LTLEFLNKVTELSINDAGCRGTTVDSFVPSIAHWSALSPNSAESPDQQLSGTLSNRKRIS